jgi:hypothetical protein
MAEVEQVARYLKHRDRAKRLQAIKALGSSKDTRALKLLAWSAKNDPDTQVQQYARKAYNYLKGQSLSAPRKGDGTGVVGAASLLAYSKRKMQESQTTQPNEPTDGTFDFGYQDEDEEPENYNNGGDDESDYYEDESNRYFDDDDLFALDDVETYATADSHKAGPIDWEARRAIHAAMEFHLDGDNAQALKKLLQAIGIDKRSTREAEALNVAAAITNMDGQAAIEAIQDPDFQRSFLNMTERKKREAGKDDPDWGTAWMDIGIFGLVMTAGIVILALVFSLRLTPVLMDVANNPGQYAAFYADTEITSNDLRAFVSFMEQGVPILILIALATAVGSIISTLVQYLAVHFAVVTFFDGKKPSAVTIDKMFYTSSVIVGVTFVILIGSMLFVPSNPAAYSDGSAALVIGGLSLGGVGLLSLVTFIGAIWQVAVLAKAQGIGWISGCLSIIVGGMILTGIQCVFQIAFPLLVGIINALG